MIYPGPVHDSGGDKRELTRKELALANAQAALEYHRRSMEYTFSGGGVDMQTCQLMIHEETRLEQKLAALKERE